MNCVPSGGLPKISSVDGRKAMPASAASFAWSTSRKNFMSEMSNPNSGLDWPVRLLVYEDAKGKVWTAYAEELRQRPMRRVRPARGLGRRDGERGVIPAHRSNRAARGRDRAGLGDRHLDRREMPSGLKSMSLE
jgi:hypothetical protein